MSFLPHAPPFPDVPLVLSGGHAVAALALSALGSVTRGVARFVNAAGSHAAWLAGTDVHNPALLCSRFALRCKGGDDDDCCRVPVGVPYG